jgi:hypothetical protein
MRAASWCLMISRNRLKNCASTWNEASP